MQQQEGEEWQELTTGAEEMAQSNCCAHVRTQAQISRPHISRDTLLHVCDPSANTVRWMIGTALSPGGLSQVPLTVGNNETPSVR